MAVSAKTMTDRQLIIPDSMSLLVERAGYVPAVKVGKTLYCAGQVGRTPDLEVIEDPEQQFRAAWGKSSHCPGRGWLHLPGRGRADDVPRRPAQAHAGVQAREGCAFSQGDVRLDLHRRRRTGPCRTPRGDQVHRRAAIDLAGCAKHSGCHLFLQPSLSTARLVSASKTPLLALSARSPRVSDPSCRAIGIAAECRLRHSTARPTSAILQPVQEALRCGQMAVKRQRINLLLANVDAELLALYQAGIVPTLELARTQTALTAKGQGEGTAVALYLQQGAAPERMGRPDPSEAAQAAEGGEPPPVPSLETLAPTISLQAALTPANGRPLAAPSHSWSCLTTGKTTRHRSDSKPFTWRWPRLRPEEEISVPLLKQVPAKSAP